MAPWSHLNPGVPMRTRLWLPSMSPQQRVSPVTSPLEPVLCLPSSSSFIVLLSTVSGLCWLLLPQEFPAVPLTSTLDSVLTSHTITPLQDL